MALWYHKIDSYKWLNGSIREDLLPDERGVWADLLALASLTREPRRGHIERSEGIPYKKNQLLMMLVVSEELFDRTVNKCLNEGRLQVYDDGTMYVTNYGRYNDTADYESKKAAKRHAIEKARETKRREEAAIESAITAINKLNGHLKSPLYQVQSDGSVINVKTGEHYRDAQRFITDEITRLSLLTTIEAQEKIIKEK